MRGRQLVPLTVGTLEKLGHVYSGLLTLATPLFSSVQLCLYWLGYHQAVNGVIVVKWNNIIVSFVHLDGNCLVVRVRHPRGDIRVNLYVANRHASSR